MIQCTELDSRYAAKHKFVLGFGSTKVINGSSSVSSHDSLFAMSKHNDNSLVDFVCLAARHRM